MSVMPALSEPNRGKLRVSLTISAAGDTLSVERELVYIS